MVLRVVASPWHFVPLLLVFNSFGGFVWTKLIVMLIAVCKRLVFSVAGFLREERT